MEPVKLAEGIYWVGVIDWNLREFHGYSTRRGTTYNSYLVIDDKITLVDTVKRPFFNEMSERVRSLVDFEDIDYVISNHTELDHAGSLPAVMDLAEKATVVTSEKFGEAAIKKSFKSEWPLMPVKDGSELQVGRHTFKFVPVPMLHWPDSMVTYLTGDNILFSNDSFGQHLASSTRFDDQLNVSVVMSEARKYYANILMPFPDPCQRALDKLKAFTLNMIAPAHGIIWRSQPGMITEAYSNWAKGQTRNKALVLFDTMYGSTETMARAMAEAMINEGVDIRLYTLANSDWSDIITEVMDSRAILVGSSTMNNCMLTPVAGFLNYLKGLRPKGKIGAAFGSYGWGGGAARAIEEEMKAAGMVVQEPGLTLKFVPTDAEIQKCREFAKGIAERIKEQAVT